MSLHTCKLIFAISQMRHQRVNVERLARRLKMAIGSTPPAQIARAAKIDPSRITRFLNGDFRKMTPVLGRLCSSLNVPVDKFLIDPPASDFSAELLGPLRRIVGRDPKRIRVATRLLRSLEALVGMRHPAKGRRRQI